MIFDYCNGWRPSTHTLTLRVKATPSANCSLVRLALPGLRPHEGVTLLTGVEELLPAIVGRLGVDQCHVVTEGRRTAHDGFIEEQRMGSINRILHINRQ